jgi:hypothetical protein
LQAPTSGLSRSTASIAAKIRARIRHRALADHDQFGLVGRGAHQGPSFPVCVVTRTPLTVTTSRTRLACEVRFLRLPFGVGVDRVVDFTSTTNCAPRCSQPKMAG